MLQVHALTRVQLFIMMLRGTVTLLHQEQSINRNKEVIFLCSNLVTDCGSCVADRLSVA